MSKSIFVGSTVPYVLNSYNACVGYSGMYSINGGTGNVSVGTYALGNCVIGSNNVAVGTNSLASCTGSSNTAIGVNSSFNLLGNTGNTTVGFNSYLQGTGLFNTVIGAYAGYSMTGANYNTILGYNAGSGLKTGTGNIIIGANTMSKASGSYQFILGDTNFQASVVGITGNYDNNGTQPTTQQLNYLKTLIGSIPYSIPLTMTGFNKYHAEFYAPITATIPSLSDAVVAINDLITNQFPPYVLYIDFANAIFQNISGGVLNLSLATTVIRTDSVASSDIWVLYYFLNRTGPYLPYSSTNAMSVATNITLSSTFNYMTTYAAQLNTVVQLNPGDYFSVHIQNQSGSSISYGTLNQFVGSSYGVTLFTSLLINQI